MKRNPYSKSFRLITVLQAVDILTINLLLVMYYFIERIIDHYPVFFDHKLAYWIIINVSYLVSINVYYMVAHKHLVRPELIISRVARTILLQTIIALALVCLTEINDPPIKTVLVYYVATFLCISAERLFIRKSLKYFRYSGRNNSNVLFVGRGDVMEPIRNVVNDPWNGYHLCATLDNPMETLEYLKTHSIDEVYCGIHRSEFSAYNEVLKYCEMNVIHFYIIPDIQTYLKRHTSLFMLGDASVMTFHLEPLKNPYKRFIKRLMDVIISGLFVCTFYPIIYILVGGITKLTNPGPVYFRQKRTGINGETFCCLKFRSMRVNGVSDKLQATKGDPRVTRFGRFLRKCNIDEFPQFINVLKGDMSIVGPRPHMLAHTEYYSEQIDEYMVRHYVRPGITGWAQINGSRGETKTIEDMQRRVDLDIWYLENWSAWLDVIIIFKTFIKTFIGDKCAY
jgi:Undecaprenyl-phosphate glucose phosphotransferase